jgi:hypothetical protein
VAHGILDLVCGLIRFQPYDEQRLPFRTFTRRETRVNVLKGLIETLPALNRKNFDRQWTLILSGRKRA